MLLVKKMQLFFHFLFSVKIRLDIRFNNVLDRKKTFFDYKKQHFSTSPKSYFSKGVNPYFWSKNAIFSIFSFRSK